jgi:hypothetical protein
MIAGHGMRVKDFACAIEFDQNPLEDNPRDRLCTLDTIQRRKLITLP